MKIIPVSRNEWLGLILAPFKVFVPGGYLMVAFRRETLGLRHDTADFTGLVLNGYILTFFVLVVGAIFQRGFGQHKSCLWTCAFVGALFVFGFLSLPYLART